MSRFALNYPIATFMAMCAIMFFGIRAVASLSVSLYPNVDIPVVTITTIYPGANAQSVESKVTDKIEEAVSGISNLKKITSTSANSVSVVVVEFELEKDIEEATNDVRDKVSTASFPSDVHSPIIEKFDVGGAPVISLFLSLPEESAHDFLQLHSHANDVIKPMLQRLRGVGRVNLVGYLQRQVFILPDPMLLNKYGLSYTDIANSVRVQNVEIDGGRIVRSENEIDLLTDSSVHSLADLQSIMVGNGVALGELATIEDGLQEARSFSALGVSATSAMKGVAGSGILFEIQKLSGANDIEIADSVRALYPELLELSSGYQLEIVSDSTPYIKTVIEAVKFDLLFGAFLAVFVVFVFLRNTTMTLVAALSIPVSIFGTFALMQLLGLNLNLVTMVAITLSIGIIIDDAIVVVENIHRRIENGEKPRAAALAGVNEILFALVAISAMLLAVFLPIADMDGIVGRFFTSFGLSVVVAIVISFVVVVSFMPMLASRLLRERPPSRFFVATQGFFENLETTYTLLLRFVLSHKLASLLCVFALFMLSLFVLSRLSIEFLPSEDKSEFDIKIIAKPGISLQAMQRLGLQVQEEVDRHEGVDYSLLLIGYTAEQKIHEAKIRVALIERKKRLPQEQIMNSLRENLVKIADESNVRINLVEIPPISLGDDDSPLQVAISAYDDAALEQSTRALIALLSAHPKMTDVHTNAQPQKPQITLRIDRAEANRLGISAFDIALALRNAFSGAQEISIYKEHGKEYDIILRNADSRRANLDNLHALQLRNAKNETIFLEGLVHFEESEGITAIKRYDRQHSITVAANFLPDFTLGDAVAFVEAHASGENGWLAGRAHYVIEGYGRFLQETTAAFVVAMLTAAVLIYFILASLYESLLQPFIIMVTLPLSFTGAFLGLWLFGENLSLFSLMGLMLLMGLVGKNATLIIDVANAHVKQGIAHSEAIVRAGKERLRPILMTTLAMVFGMIPLASSSGAGSAFKSPLGITVIGGLLIAMFLSLLVVPILYHLMDPLDSRLRKLYE
ncbi:MAG: efflux RND transporter permease subunit [Helicobacter sp.]|nr:efflux RND transporter permease subunit [Helicobacter sp.]